MTFVASMALEYLPMNSPDTAPVFRPPSDGPNLRLDTNPALCCFESRPDISRDTAVQSNLFAACRTSHSFRPAFSRRHLRWLIKRNAAGRVFEEVSSLPLPRKHNTAFQADLSRGHLLHRPLCPPRILPPEPRRFPCPSHDRSF